MKISTNRTNLLNAVKTALKSSGNSKDIPELGCLLFEADADAGLITVTGTDATTQIQCRLRGEHVLESGTMLIKPIVSGMLSLLPTDTVEMDIGSDRMLDIKSGNCTYGVPVLDPKKFPRVQIPFPEDFICVKGLNTIIRRTVFAAELKSQDQYRQSLQFVRLSFADGKATAEATNGQIAALSQTPHVCDGKLDLILHRKALSILASIVSPNDELYVGIAGKRAVFMKEDMLFASLLYCGDYIEGSKLVNYIKPVYRATTDAKKLYELAESISSMFYTGDDPCIHLRIADGKVEMEGKTATCAIHSEVPATETVPTDENGFHYQAKWLTDCLKQTSGPLTLSLDPRGFMLIEANQSKYCVGPRSPARIQKDKEQKGRSVKKTAAKKAA